MKSPLRRVRERHGITITRVATAIGIDPGSLSRIERGHQVPSIALAERLSHFFNGEVQEIEIFHPNRYSAMGVGLASESSPRSRTPRVEKKKGRRERHATRKETPA